jgi:hypothetical protein
MSPRDFSYLLERTNRETLEIAVLPNGRVQVKAPTSASDEEVERRVLRRKPWIMRQLAFFQDFEPRPSPRHYAAGETHLYLGKRYRLRLLAGESSVNIEDGYLVVRTRDTSPAVVAKVVEGWQRKCAKNIFPTVVDKAWARFEYRIDRKPKLCVKTLTRRWGSLSPNGILTLNLALIQAPLPCIEYVACHELCHIEHQDHGPKFYAKLEQVLPSWKDQKKRLERSIQF